MGWTGNKLAASVARVVQEALPPVALVAVGFMLFCMLAV